MEVRKLNNLHLKCFPGFMELFGNLVSWNFHVSCNKSCFRFKRTLKR